MKPLLKGAILALCLIQVPPVMSALPPEVRLTGHHHRAVPLFTGASGRSREAAGQRQVPAAQLRAGLTVRHQHSGPRPQPRGRCLTAAALSPLPDSRPLSGRRRPAGPAGRERPHWCGY